MKKEGEPGEEGERILCPLCQEGFKSKDTLEEHAMQLHSINAEGLQRLMMLMQGSHWLNSMKKTDRDEEEGDAGGKPSKYKVNGNLTEYFFLRSRDKDAGGGKESFGAGGQVLGPRPTLQV